MAKFKTGWNENAEDDEARSYAKIGFTIGLLGPAVIGLPFGVGWFEMLAAGIWIGTVAGLIGSFVDGLMHKG